jgi:hypothetical protein
MEKEKEKSKGQLLREIARISKNSSISKGENGGFPLLQYSYRS